MSKTRELRSKGTPSALTPDAKVTEAAVEAELEWPNLASAAARQRYTEPYFPTTIEELEALAKTRRARWQFVRILEELEHCRPLTAEEREVGHALCARLSDDLALLFASLGDILHDCIDRPDPSTWAAASAFWQALDISDQIDLRDRLASLKPFCARFCDEPDENSVRVRAIRLAAARDLESAHEPVVAHAARTSNAAQGPARSRRASRRGSGRAGGAREERS